MRKLGLISSLILASLVTVYACALESTPDPSKTTSGTSTVNEPTAADDSTGAEPLGTSSDAVINPLSGCAHVVFCDKPNSSIGTVCQQDGCTLASAESECLSDLSALGCTLHCPAQIITSGGSTVTFRLSCGGRCCPAGTAFCGLNGACCDGVHATTNCPG